MKKTAKNFQNLPPIRVRREPPTVDEAVTAALDLADEIEQQVEIAAGLIGLPLDEVRPHVVAAAKVAEAKPVEQRFNDRFERTAERVVSPAGANRAPRTVVVERRTRPTIVVERRGRPLDPRR